MTTTLDRNGALAICFSNLKGSKTKDLLRTATALKYLRELPEFGSNQSVGKRVGVSGEIVRQFISLLDLPPSIRHYFDNNDLGLEHGRRLWQINQLCSQITEDAALAMTSMTAMEARDLVDYLKRNPSSSIDEALDALNQAKPVITEEHLVCALVSNSEYEALASLAKRKKLSVNDLVASITRLWLKENDDKRI